MRAAFYGVGLFVVTGIVAWITWDILTSKSTPQEGIIKELLFIEGRNVAAYTPYQGRKVGDHAIVVARNPQYIAIVTNDRGEDFQVHCTKEHFVQLKVGDVLQYKKYEGETFHIRYFAHYEDH